MCETMSELNFQSLMNCDQLELGGIDMGMGFQEFIPDMFQESSVVPDLSAGVLSYPVSHEHFNDIPLSHALKPELCELSTFQYTVRPEQQQHYQQEWKSFNVPSTTTSPVQYEGGMQFNTVPTAYEQQHFQQTNFTNGRKRRAVHQPCEDTLDFGTAFQGGMDEIGGKPKRKRTQNARQRKAANVRERKRMYSLNEAFDSLKTRVPTFAYEKRLSRIETLKLAMTYISFMTQVVDGKKPDEISLGEDGLDSFSIEDLGRFKSALTSSYISDSTESSESGTSSS